MINHEPLTLPDRRIISVVLFYPPPALANSADDQPWSHFAPLLRRPLGGTDKKKEKKNNEKQDQKTATKINKQKTNKRTSKSLTHLQKASQTLAPINKPIKKYSQPQLTSLLAR